jgi:hypothetical protein
MRLGILAGAGSLLLLPCLVLPVAPVAAENPSPPATHGITGSMGLVSDYVFRGETYSDGKPAIQGSLDYQYKSRVRGGFWASSGSQEIPLEIDLYAGWTPRVNRSLTLEFRVTGYVYPHDPGQNSLELALLAMPRSFNLGYYYDFVLNQHYGEVGGSHDRGPWRLVGRAGYVYARAEEETFRPGGPGKPVEDRAAWDWELNVGYRLTASLRLSGGMIGHETSGERIVLRIQSTSSILSK